MTTALSIEDRSLFEEESDFKFIASNSILLDSDCSVLSDSGLMKMLDSGLLRAYSFELDETQFVLDANLLREALDITPIDQAHLFVSPPSGDAIMDFVNELGYTEVIHFVSRMAVNNMYPALESNIVYDQLMSPQANFWAWNRPQISSSSDALGNYYNTDSAEMGGTRNVMERKLQVCSERVELNKFNQERNSGKSKVGTFLFHLVEEDLRLGNLKFVSKGEVDEVFGIPIPNEPISNNIRNAPYYSAYLEMVAKHDQKVTAEKEGKKKTASAKQPKSKSAIENSVKPTPVAKPKPAKEKPSKPSTAKPPKPKPAKPTPLQKTGKGKVTKVHNVKSSFQLVVEPDEEPAQPEPKPELEQEGEGEEYDMECAIQMSLESFQAQGHAHVGVDLHTKEASTGPTAQPQDDTSANIVHDSLSSADAEIGVGSDKINSGGDTEILQITNELG
ncbi:hypothetical protein Tco_0089901 [Tanacetum coccineum]